MSAPAIKGEKQEIKAGLFSITCNSEKGKLLAFWNSSSDLQFNVALQFQEPQVEILGDTQNEGDKYAVSLYPGETKEVVQGKWKAMRRTMSFGAPDKEWQDQQAAKQNTVVDGQVQAMKQALKQHPKADGKYTGEYVAQVAFHEKVPFVDLTYPPKTQSLFRAFEPKLPEYAWMRPSTYVKDGTSPCLYVGEIEPNDIDQGQLGDCYFMCSIACVSEFPELIKQIFAAEQNPALGIYRAAFCKNGWWQLCTVDDLMPINSATKLPVFAKNREEPNELWVSLLEKVYAKLHGSYAAIKAGDPAQAMADLIGGPYEKFKNRPEWEDKDKFFNYLLECDENDQLMCLGTPGVDTSSYATGGGADPAADAKATAEKYKAVGLCSGHAFSLIRVKRTKPGHRLVMIRNPWGSETEWNGDWSDDSSLWTDELKKEVGFYAGNDGTFWMSYEDMLKWFEAGSVTYPLRNWYQMRVAANFEKGVPDLLLQIEVPKKATKFWFGAHQRDNRGLPTGDKDRKYLGLLISVLQKVEGSDKTEKEGSSGGGSFQLARDVFAECTLAPNTKSTTYYVLVQSYQDEDKSFTMSCFADNADVKISFVSYKEGEGKKYNPVSKFPPSTASQKVAANYQVLTPNNKLPLEGSGDLVNWNTTTSLIKKVDLKGTARKEGAAAATSSSHADPHAGVTTSASGAGGAKKLSVGVLLGRNLVAKDSNGFSDPFITLILQDKTGKAYKKQEHSTKYINKTLNPTWGETFVFDLGSVGASAANGDVILAECWDKDIFGKDPMGKVKIPLSSLGIEPGGPAKIDFYPLAGDDATGDIQLVFSYV